MELSTNLAILIIYLKAVRIKIMVANYKFKMLLPHTIQNICSCVGFETCLIYVLVVLQIQNISLQIK